MLDLIANTLDQEVLNPKLVELGLNPDLYGNGYDVTELTQDPDRKAEALAANARGAISNRALRGYTGFGDEDTYDLATVDGWVEWAQNRVSADPNLLPLLALGGGRAPLSSPNPPQPPQQNSWSPSPSAAPSSWPVNV